MRKILILGGSGFVGSAIYIALAITLGLFVSKKKEL